jgi:hypothetical protein
MVNVGSYFHFDGIAFRNRFVQIWILDQKKSVVDGVAEENAGK